MADYAISNVSRRVVYAASGTGPYAFTFEILAAGDIAVYKGDTLLTLTTDYTVSISSNGTGSVTLVATAGTSNITIVGSKTIARTTDFTTGGDFFANTLNDELDAQTIFIQQIAETAERGLKAPVTDPTDINMTLPRKADRANKYLAFDADGNPQPGDTAVEVTAVAAIADEIETVAGISDEVVAVAGNSTNIDLVAGSIGNVNSVGSNISNVNTVAGNSTNINTVAGNNSNITTVAGISANVTTVAGISANVTSVAGNATNINAVAADATDIGTVATNITSVNTVATNISAVNTNASNITAIQNASTNATNAAASAVSAGNAQTAAEAARDATLAAYDNFDDRYLGSKTSDPTVDNDGNALVAGALYFNSSSGTMKVYTGSAWVAAYVSGTGYLASANNLSDVASASTSRTNLGLGTLSTLSPSGTASSSTYLRGDNTWATINVTPALDDLSDVTISTPATDQVLKYNGSGWVNGAAPDSSLMKNRIINGAMVIDQRNAGASVTPTASAYLVDRWVLSITQASKLSAQQTTTAPTGFVNSLKFTSTSAYSVASGDYFAVGQPIEGFNTADLGWGTANAKTVTLSFQVYSSLTGTFGGAIFNDAGNRSYPFTYTVSSANTWTTASVTIAGDTSGTWFTDNRASLKVYFGLGVGTTYSGTAGSWSGNLYLSATGATSVVGTSGATFYITGVQLEVGSNATGFEYRQYQQELALCQRYYQLYDAGLVSGTTSGNSYGVSATCTVAPRTTPTVSWISPTLGVNGFPTTSPNMTDIKAYSCLVWMTANATQGASSWQNRVAFSAEL